MWGKLKKELENRLKDVEEKEKWLKSERKQVAEKEQKLDALINFLTNKKTQKLDEEYLLADSKNVYIKQREVSVEIYFLYQETVYYKIKRNTEPIADIPWTTCYNLPDDVFKYFYNNKKCN